MKKIADKFKKAVRYRKRYGNWNFFKNAFFRFTPFISYFETVIVIKDLEKEGALGVEQLQLSINFIKESEFDEIYRIKQNSEMKQGMDSCVIQNRLSNGEKCFVSKLDGKICAYAWVVFGKKVISNYERTITIEKDEAYIHDCLTLPEYRGKNIFPQVLRYIFDYLNKKSIKRIISLIYINNLSSVRTFEKAGFVEKKLLRQFAIPKQKKAICIAQTLKRK